MEYNVNPDVKKPLMIVILTAAFGLALALTPTFLKSVPSYFFHLPAMLVFLVCILFLSRFVLTNYTYQLYDAANTMSNYPKLNIYRIRKSGSRMVYCIPFNNIQFVKRVDKIPKSSVPRENLCASLSPKEIYAVRYFVDGKPEEVYLECSAGFAAEIERRINDYSEVIEENAET